MICFLDLFQCKKILSCISSSTNIPSFLPAEKGDFLALDLGGTNFRVLHVRVVEEEQKVVKMDSEICAIPLEMMQGPGEKVTRTQRLKQKHLTSFRKHKKKTRYKQETIYFFK